MSKHDCRLSGTVTIAAGVTREQLYAAAKPYIEHHKLTHNLVDPLAEPDEFSSGDLALTFVEDDRELTFHADVRGWGSYWDDQLEALIQALSPLADGPQVLEFEDFDSSSRDESLCAHFFGPTPADEIRARFRYAAEAFAEWAGHSGLSGIVQSLAETFPVAGCLGSPDRNKPLPSGVMCTDLLVTVLHERERGLEFDSCELSDIRMEITEGGSIGFVMQLEERELAAHEVGAELLAVGNDGTFFGELATVRQEAQDLRETQSVDPVDS